jgi:flavin-dependent dehydrogenase
LLIAVVAALAAIGAVIAACERQPEPSVEAYCREITSAEGLDESLANFDAAALEPQVAALKRASKVAPLEIAPQVNTLVTLTTALQTTIATARTDQAAALEQTLRERAGELAAVTEAGKAVETYTRDNCGIELNSTAVPTSTPG